jgi:hypothetical protein
MGLSAGSSGVHEPDKRTIEVRQLNIWGAHYTMGKVKPPEPALLFIGALYADKDISSRSKEILKGIYGDVMFESPSWLWDYSSHYREELGWPIFRQFIFFGNIIDPAILADIKLKTNELEDGLATDGKRRINLDPGYLTLPRIVLASTKNRAHRIYLGKGIYGEVSLLYRDREGAFMPHLFTYRDYQDEKTLAVFLNARTMLKAALQASRVS